MLAYLDQDGNKTFCDYDTIEQKNNLVEQYHNRAKSFMREECLLEFRYSIIDFVDNTSLVFVLVRNVTETFELTGY
jgi:hypothetical protein